MSLIQRNAVPLFLLMAVIAVGIGVFATTSPFAFGEEPEGCDAAAVGISVYTTDDQGNVVTVVSNGDVVSYRVTLSIPELPAGETACNYQGGMLTVTTPDGATTTVAGPENPEGGIPMIQVGAPFTADSVDYTVDQNNAVNGELTVRASYAGGESLSVAEGEQPPEAAASVSNVLRMTPPSIAIEKSTSTPVIFDGQTAVFNIRVINTGGFDLSNVTVTDDQVAECNGMSFGSLAVGEDKSGSCETIISSDITNSAQASASVVGGAPAGMETVVSEADSASVTVDNLEIGIVVETDTPHVRVPNQGNVTISVNMPTQSPVSNIAVAVAAAPQCDNNWESLPAGATETYTCMVETDPDIEGSLALGTTTITGVVTGSVPDVPLTAEDSTDISVFNADLIITISPETQTIRDGDSAVFTVTVSNQGDATLTDVTVSNETVPECAAEPFDLDAGASQEYECVSSPLSEDMTTTVNAVATAADEQEVSAEDSADVIILRPSTAIGVSEVSTSVLQLVIQTLKVTETNDGDSSLINVCVELDPTGTLLPVVNDAGEGMMEGEGMEGEAMEAEATDPCAGTDPDIVVLTRDSVEFVGGDTGDDGVMDVGETWEWRVVTVGIAGNYVGLAEGAESMNFVAVGHGTDELGGDVTYPADAEELGEIGIPIVTP